MCKRKNNRMHMKELYVYTDEKQKHHMHMGGKLTCKRKKHTHRCRQKKNTRADENTTHRHTENTNNLHTKKNTTADEKSTHVDE